MKEHAPVIISDDGEARCPICEEVIWRVPGKKQWIEGGRRPKAQDLLFAAHFGHLMKKHPETL